MSSRKSEIFPVQRLIHLGFGIDSTNSSFFLPERRRLKFRGLRERLLTSRTATLHDMQSFIGKCNSLNLVFPAFNLFARECRLLLSTLGDSPLPLSPSVLEEIRFWCFVDSFTEPVPWRREQHLVLRFASDASNFAWGASMETPDGQRFIRDYWSSSFVRVNDINVKEATALYHALQSFSDLLWDRRVDALVDNQALWHAWRGLRASSPDLASVLRSVFLHCLEFNVDLRLIWVPSAANPADAPSREISMADSHLSQGLRDKVWLHYGPLYVDLMALPSNVFRRPDGSSLPFFSPTPCPGSAAVNVFAQSRPAGGILYAFPPFVMVASLLRLFLEWGNVNVVLVLPEFSRPSQWWCFLQQFVLGRLPLSTPSDLHVLHSPSRAGYVPNVAPLLFALTAFRCFFPAWRIPKPRSQSPRAPVRVLVSGDSVLRPLVGLLWPHPFDVDLVCTSGATMDVVLRRLFDRSSVPPDACVVHAGINDASRASSDIFAAVFGKACERAKASVPVFCATSRVIVSGLMPSRDAALNIKVGVGNGLLRGMCNDMGWAYSSYDSVVQSDLFDNVHLNAGGVAKLHRRIWYMLRQSFGVEIGVSVFV